MTERQDKVVARNHRGKPTAGVGVRRRPPTAGVIDQLVAADTPVNQADAEWQRLPLHIAAGNGRPASVRRLLAHGADPNLRDPQHHHTPLEWCQPDNRYLDSPAHDEVDAILRPLTQAGGAATSAGS